MKFPIPPRFSWLWALVLGGFVVSVLGGAPGSAGALSSQEALREGIALYQNSEFEKAAQKFLEAQSLRPNDPVTAYNLANSFYQQGKFQEALQEYTRTASRTEDPNLKFKSIYNTGNALFKLGQLEASAAAYKRALELDPGDMDAKYNLEYVRELMKKNPPQKESPRPPDQKSENPDSFGKKKDPNASSSTPLNEPEPSKPPGNSGARDKEIRPDPEPPPPPHSASPNKRDPGESPPAPAGTKPRRLTRQEAEQWLSTLNEDLKKFSRRQAEREAGQGYRGKDW